MLYNIIDCVCLFVLLRLWYVVLLVNPTYYRLPINGFIHSLSLTDLYNMSLMTGIVTNCTK